MQDDVDVCVQIGVVFQQKKRNDFKPASLL